MMTETNLGANDMIGSYRIIRPLGRGGMATVYEAQHTILPRHVAIKVMHPELRRHPGMASRLVQEASILDSLQLPGVARVFDCGMLADHRPWIAMELIEGESLSQRMAALGPLPAAEVLALLVSVADTLDTVHERKIVHRDLKPDNILLTPKDERFPLRLIDWGIARLGVVGRLTVEGSSIGTPTYMSPEQVCGREIGAPCDIYALGVIAYEALCGEAPFEGSSLAEVVCMHLHSFAKPLSERCTDAPAGLCALIHSMLEKRAADRPTAGQVRDLARGLAEALTEEPYYDTIVLDPEVSEDVVQLRPSDRIRWTPDISHPDSHPEDGRSRTPSTRYLIRPRHGADQVAGEITTPRRRQ